jgi:hypothetical protein
MNLKISYFDRYFFIFFLFIQTVPASAAIYVHQESGNVTVYSNVEKMDGKIDEKNTTNRNDKSNERTIQIAKTAVRKNEFPRITKELQQERNLSRISILNAELEAEQKAFQSATEQRATADILQRHVINIAALKREISASR